MDDYEIVYNKIRDEIRKENKFTNLEVPNLFTKKLGSYMLIRDDLIFIKENTQQLIRLNQNKKESENNIRISLWYAIIAIYGKCFTQNKAGMSVLNKNECVPDNGLNEIHEHLLALRHSYVAHRDDTEHEKFIVYLQIPNDHLPSRNNYKIKSYRSICADNETLHQYVELFDVLIKYSEEKIQINADKVNKTFCSTFSAEEVARFKI